MASSNKWAKHSLISIYWPRDAFLKPNSSQVVKSSISACSGPPAGSSGTSHESATQPTTCCSVKPSAPLRAPRLCHCRLLSEHQSMKCKNISMWSLRRCRLTSLYRLVQRAGVNQKPCREFKVGWSHFFGMWAQRVEQWLIFLVLPTYLKPCVL